MSTIRQKSIYYMQLVLRLNIFPDKDDVCIVERLFSSSLVAIVSLSAPRKLKVCHFKVCMTIIIFVFDMNNCLLN